MLESYDTLLAVAGKHFMLDVYETPGDVSKVYLFINKIKLLFV